MTEEDIDQWSKSVMHVSEIGMPIGLWLIHEQNKDKPIFSQKKH